MRDEIKTSFVIMEAVTWLLQTENQKEEIQMDKLKSLTQGIYNRGKYPRAIIAYNAETSIPYCLHKAFPVFCVRTFIKQLYIEPAAYRGGLRLVETKSQISRIS